VGQGQIVGPLGTTGQSTGPHDHVQLSRSSMPWVHGTEVDPWPQILDVLASATGGGLRPFPRQETDMYRLVHNHVTGKAEMIGPTGLRAVIDTDYHLGLCIRVLKSLDAGDPMMPGELDIVATYQRAVWPLSGGID